VAALDALRRTVLRAASAPGDPAGQRDTRAQGEPAGFDDPGLLAVLDGCDAARLDALAFGVIRLDRSLVVTGFNTEGIETTGLMPERVLGRPFFSAVAPCMNNVLVAARFETEPELDAVIDYVLTFRVRPVPTRLRLLASAGSAHLYLLMERV
jgi:photoactive yellow protein